MPDLLIWYATATGTAADVADRLRRGARRRGLATTVRSIETATLVRASHRVVRTGLGQDAMWGWGQGLTSRMSKAVLGCMCPSSPAHSPALPTLLPCLPFSRRPFSSAYSPSLCPSMQQGTFQLLAGTGSVAALVVATAGQGEEPPSLQPLWRALARKSVPAGALAGVHIAVFGLGDSSYPKYASPRPSHPRLMRVRPIPGSCARPCARRRFNYAAKKLHRRLEQLGAITVLPRGDGDDQHRLGCVPPSVPAPPRTAPLRRPR